jgi:hypothetical protein
MVLRSTPVGEALSRVVYVGLSYPDPVAVRWDFNDWHWPELAVELTTTTGRVYVATPEQRRGTFELVLKSSAPGAATAGAGLRTWDVSGHTRWRPLLNVPIAECDPVPLARETENGTNGPPVAVRLATDAGATAWIVAAGPCDLISAATRLTADAVWLGHDEVIVVFGDEGARRIGLASGGGVVD